MMVLLAGICFSFLLGAIPTGVWVGRWIKGVDIRQEGSGNVGATNVLRVAGKWPALLVLLVDVAKGWIPVAVLAPGAIRMNLVGELPTLQILWGMAAVAGHIWNPFLQWKGGRGVATSLGVLFGLNRLLALGTLGVWIAAAVLTRYVSVASVSAAFAAPFLAAWMGLPTAWVLGAILVSLSIIARHRPNLLRLLHGEEHRLGNPRRGL